MRVFKSIVFLKGVESRRKKMEERRWREREKERRISIANDGEREKIQGVELLIYIYISIPSVKKHILHLIVSAQGPAYMCLHEVQTCSVIPLA